MKKIEIEFPVDFESDKVGAIAIGRLLVGNSVVRMFFTPEGKVKLFIPQSAVDSKDVEIYPDPPDELLGFDKAPVKK